MTNFTEELNDTVERVDDKLQELIIIGKDIKSTLSFFSMIVCGYLLYLFVHSFF